MCYDIFCQVKSSGEIPTLESISNAQSLARNIPSSRSSARNGHVLQAFELLFVARILVPISVSKVAVCLPLVRRRAAMKTVYSWSRALEVSGPTFNGAIIGSRIDFCLK